jgi:hypothetical protein
MAVPYPWAQALGAVAGAVLWALVVPGASEKQKLPSGTEADPRDWVLFWAPAQYAGGIAWLAFLNGLSAAAVVLVAVSLKWTPVTKPGLALVNGLVYLGTAQAILRANLTGATMSPAATMVSAWRGLQDNASAKAAKTAADRVEAYGARLTDGDHASDDMRLIEEAQYLTQYYYGGSKARVGFQDAVKANATYLIPAGTAATDPKKTGPDASDARDYLRELVVTLATDGYYDMQKRYARWHELSRALPGSHAPPGGFWEWLLRRRYEP